MVAAVEPTQSSAGWHPDPSGRYEFRYYNGERWTADVSVHGQRFVDPVSGPAQTASDGHSTFGPGATPGSFGPGSYTPGSYGPGSFGPGAPQGWGAGQQRPSRPPRGFAIATFVVGLGAFVTGWVPFVFVLGAVGAVTALVFGIIALSRIRSAGAGGKGFAITGTVLAVAAFGSAFVGFQLTRKVVDSFDEFIDVGKYRTEVTRCTIDGTLVEFEGTITNQDDEMHSYTVTVSYLLDGRITDSDSLSVPSVAPGETAEFQGTGFIRDSPSGSVPRCRIDTVTGPLPFGPTD